MHLKHAGLEGFVQWSQQLSLHILLQKEEHRPETNRAVLESLRLYSKPM